MTGDMISRQAAISVVGFAMADSISITREDWNAIIEALEALPSVQPERKRGEWTTEEVAELLFNIFGDDCACNFSGIDEWLPERCKYTEIAEECPSPKEKHGCWMQFLIQGGADMIGEQDDESRSNSNAQTDTRTRGMGTTDKSSGI